MPQMMPMWWMLIYMFSLFILYLLISMLYFMMSCYPPTNTLTNNKAAHSAWNWKW